LDECIKLANDNNTNYMCNTYHSQYMEKEKEKEIKKDEIKFNNKRISVSPSPIKRKSKAPNCNFMDSSLIDQEILDNEKSGN